MATLAALRKTAKEAGVPKKAILAAATAEELQSVIDDYADHDNGNSAPRKKSAAKKKVAAKKSSGRKSAPAKSKKSGTAKRRATATKRSNGYVPKGGRNTLDRVNFSQTDGWNPREGSAPALIIAALKKSRGDRDKAFDLLVKNIGDFVSKKKRNGEKRSKDEMHDMLRYRISRTLWEFATRTGQHEASDNRVEYGTGDTGQGIFKRAKRTTAKTRTKTKTRTTAKRKSTKTKTRAKAGSRR